DSPPLLYPPRTSLRARRRRRRAELQIARVDGCADLGERLALGLQAHHVTRDVEAERSGRGVARERDVALGLGLHVAGPVRAVTEVGAAARARHPTKRVRVRRSER